MLFAAILSCFVFSYRCEKANLYALRLWKWLGADAPTEIGNFQEFWPAPGALLRQMALDEMNWAVLVAAAAIVWWLP